MLMLKSELPRADCFTPSQVSTLEPLLGTLLGSLWCPPNHISLNFPIWGSCAWFMNPRIHVFSMKMNGFQVVSGALMAWSWLLLVFDWMDWRRKKGQLVEASQLSVTSPSALCHMRNDGILACEGRVYPLMDTCPLLI